MDFPKEKKKVDRKGSLPGERLGNPSQSLVFQATPKRSFGTKKRARKEKKRKVRRGGKSRNNGGAFSVRSDKRRRPKRGGVSTKRGKGAR